MQLHLLSGAVLAALLPGAAWAQSSQATELDRLTVTGTRTAVTVDESLAAVEVIDRDEIARLQVHSLPELLRGRAGINLANSGGPGKQTSLFLRGTESDHALFLVDGIRVGSATSGLVALQDIPVELIERIEIVRGPRSSLYGADAIGGVIQVFTRRPAGAGAQPRLRVGAGSHDLREASAGVGLGSKAAWLDADVAYRRTDGINACNGFFDPATFAGAGCFIALDSQPDHDGYRNRSAALRGGLHPGEAWTLEGTALRAEGDNDYDGDFFDRSEVVQQVVGGTLRYAPDARLALQLVAGSHLDSSDNFLRGDFTDSFSSRRDSATLQGDVGLGAGRLLTLGVDWLRDRGTIFGPFVAYDRRRGNRGAFAEVQGTAGRHDLQAALRHDDNDQFGGHTTGSAAWGLDFGDGLRATASWGTAFKAPNFNELYYPFFGNPDLKPETSRSLELGLAQRRDAWHWQLAAFRTDVDELITYDTTIAAANNLDAARIRGAELTVGTTLAGWDVNGQASYADPRNRSAGSPDARLPRRARETARVDLDRASGAWRVGATWVAEGARYDDVANTLRLGGHATLDLRAEWAFASDWTLQAQLRNAFDRDYETVAFYNQPGREFGLALRYAPR